MPSNEFRTLKRKEWEGDGGKRKREEQGEKKGGTEGRKRKSSFTETMPMPGIVSFLFPLALTFGYCSSLRKKMGLS